MDETKGLSPPAEMPGKFCQHHPLADVYFESEAKGRIDGTKHAPVGI